MTGKKDLLIEIGTEELPPKSLKQLAAAFADGVHNGLQDQELEHGRVSWFATPRRFAVIIHELAVSQSDKQVEKRGPAISVAYDESGKPTKAAEGFARSCGVTVSDLDTLETGRGSWLSYKSLVKGVQTAELIPGIIHQSLAELPVLRRMRWGECDIEFVRPVHWVVLLFGKDLIRASILGVETGRDSYGHRFHHPAPITLSDAGEYSIRLREEGNVIADFEERRNRVEKSVIEAAKAAKGRALIDDDLLDETTSLVEWPVAIAGVFDDEFLKLPKEVLIAVMQVHQKYFPVLGLDGDELTADFVAISNVASASPGEIKRGNERVIRPRLSDAVFFWERDCSRPLADFGAQLGRVVFQRKLGTLEDKTERIKALGVYIANQLGIDSSLVERAARLAKCDLLTDMVGEFPALQGTMGRYYALESGENPEVARALDEQYRPRHAGADLPETSTGSILALSDRLDTLVGIFAIGQAPTGDKDPFGLRRAGLGCLRIMIECALPLDLEACIEYSADVFPGDIKARSAVPGVFDFMMERLRRYFIDKGIRSDVFDAVQACRPVSPHDFNLRVSAVEEFLQLPEADSLAAANKRIRNILKQANYADDTEPDEKLLVEKAEMALYKRMQVAGVNEPVDGGDYVSTLSVLAGLKETIDVFFDEVMVMCDDMILRNNRLALLSGLRKLFLVTADVSRLQGKPRG